MTPARVVLRDAARRDIDEAIAFYVAEGAAPAAMRFVEQLEVALRHIAEYPEAGSPRYAHELSLPGLRSWPIHGIPYVVFHVARPGHADVWRVLHAERDIPSWLR